MRDEERLTDEEAQRIGRESGSRLRALDELGDLEVADGDHDVRGWDVRGSDGRHVGEVKELLVDPDAMKVRYLDIELDREVAARDDDRRVLVPIGEARLDEEQDEVRLGLSSNRIGGAPGWSGTGPDREYETRICMLFVDETAASAGRGADDRADDFYGRSHFDEDLFWGGRRGDRESSPWLRRRDR